MTKLEFINKFLFQWFFVRLTRCTDYIVVGLRDIEVSNTEDGGISVYGTPVYQKRQWYSIQGWIWPITGWVGSFKILWRHWFIRITKQKLLPIILLLSLGAKGQTPNFAPPDSLRKWLREHANYVPASSKPLDGFRVTQDLMAMLRQEPVKYDTIKCWSVVAQHEPDSSLHLILTKSWVIREYRSCWIIKDGYDQFGRCPEPIKYLHPNKRDSMAVVGDFKPIIQEWR